jgi:polar amino acid transport system substrate-binding protein
MKRAKGVIAIVLSLVLLSACASLQMGGSRSSSPVLDRILKKGELVVGTAGTMPPFNMVTKTGVVKGFEIDLGGMIAAGMGVKARFETMPFDQLLPALETGQVDMILSDMTMTPQRNLKVAFVGPYFISGKSILTKQKNLLAAKRPIDLNQPELTFSALEGSTSQYFVQTLMPKAQLVTVKDYDQGVALVLENKVTAFVADYPICVISTFRYPDQGLAYVATPLTYEPIGIAVPAGDPQLINWLENFLDALQGSGQLAAFKELWFGDASWLKDLK